MQRAWKNRFIFGYDLPLDCHGKRLKPEALSVRIRGKNIQELTAMSINGAYEFFVEYEDNMRERDKKSP